MRGKTRPCLLAARRLNYCPAQNIRYWQSDPRHDYADGVRERVPCYREHFAWQVFKLYIGEKFPDFSSQFYHFGFSPHARPHPKVVTLQARRSRKTSRETRKVVSIPRNGYAVQSLAAQAQCLT